MGGMAMRSAVGILAMVVALQVVLGRAASADEPTDQRSDDARFEELLRAIDVVPPDRGALEAIFPDAWARLDRAARQDERDTWSRIRAVSLLSYFPEARTRATLEALAGVADKEVRRQAIYTLGRGFGAVADRALVRFIEARTGDAEPEVAAHAVRSLRFVDHPEAKLALERIADKGPAGLRTLARTTIDKRELRLKEPKRGH